MFLGKRYKSEEVYSDDGSVIIMNNNEKQNVSQLNSKIDNFLEQKNELIQILENITTLLHNYVIYKNELDVEFMVKRMIQSSVQDKNQN